jgi:glycerophosphoryl diester phosphodiesterase
VVTPARHAGRVPRFPSLRPPIGFAHRGARAHAPENTIEAFRLALRLGATGLESDVWLTSDGVAVLDHDGVVGRWPRQRTIATLSRAELPDHVPTLKELYAEVGTDVEISLDVKDPAAALEVVATARDAGVESRLWLCYPDWATVAAWRELSPEVNLVESTRVKRMVGSPERHVARSAEAGIDAVNLHHSDWSGGLVAMVHRFEMLAFGWDAQHERILDKLLDDGLDGVYSDHVDRMSAALERRAR